MTTPSDPDERTIPERIGRYRILRLLGEGGMGAVFEAEQENPRRTVALKVVAAGVLTEEMRRRFELEGQVLGYLSHPGIAKIYEAGTVETHGRPQPYFAMERIEGEPIQRYAERHRLDLRARIELIALVCDGLEHAHHRGVVHRDLKPDNILVDAEGQPKLLDFGIARTIDSDLQVTTLHTDAGRVMGTVPYMSPEQAAGEASALDARSDIYSLGVVAYELVAGRLPYAADVPAIFDALAVVRNEEPRPLSAIDRSLRGDVETVIGKALEKEPERRYGSAADFAADLRRYLNDEPVTARPPSALYQLRKFARRNRALVTGFVAVLVTLVAGLVGTTLGFLEARAEADRARRTAEFLQEILSGVDPAVAQGTDTTLLRAILDRTHERIGRELAGQARIEATIRSTMSDVFAAIADYAEAREQAERAHELMERELDPDDPELLRQRRVLAALLAKTGDEAAGEALLEEALEQTGATFGAQSQEAATVALELAILHLEQKRADAAADRFGRALAVCRRELGDDAAATLVALNGLGLARLGQGRFEEGERLLREVLERRLRVFGETDPETVKARNNLAGALTLSGREEEAAELFRAALEDYRRILGPDHATTLGGQQALATTLIEVGAWDEALELQAEVVALSRDRYGREDPRTYAAEVALARVHNVRGEEEAAEPLARHAYEGLRALEGEAGGRALGAQIELVEALSGLGRAEEARPFLDALPELHELTFGADHSKTLDALQTVAVAHVNLGDLERAEPLLRRVVAGGTAGGEREEDEHLRALYSLALTVHLLERYEEAIPLEAEFVEKWAALFGDDDTLTQRCAAGLAKALSRVDDPSPFEAEARTLAEFRRRTLPPEDPERIRARVLLADALTRNGRHAEASEHLEEALAMLAPGDELLPRARSVHGAVLTARGELAQARSQLEAAWAAEPVPSTACRMAALCEAEGRRADATVWGARAAE